MTVDATGHSGGLPWVMSYYRTDYRAQRKLLLEEVTEGQLLNYT